MQQFITSAEACALLDRILRTSQSLNSAIAKHVVEVAPPVLQPFKQSIEETPILPAIVQKPILLPPVERPATPVLTIKLADLQREARRSDERRRHYEPILRNLQPPKQRPRLQARPARRGATHDVEVLYRRSFKMVS